MEGKNVNIFRHNFPIVGKKSNIKEPDKKFYAARKSHTLCNRLAPGGLKNRWLLRKTSDKVMTNINHPNMRHEPFI